MKLVKPFFLVLLSFCCFAFPVFKTGVFFESEALDKKEITTVIQSTATEQPTSEEDNAEVVSTTQASTTEVVSTTQSTTKPNTTAKQKSSLSSSSNNDVAGTYDWQYTENSTYPINYKDSTMSINIDKVWYKSAWCYVAKIQMSDFSRMKTVCANNKFNNGTQTCLSAAKSNGAILAVNACHSDAEQNIPVVRNGQAWNKSEDLVNFPACYNKYTGILGSTSAFNLWGVSIADAIKQNKLTDAFCFGPEFDMTNLQNNDDGSGGGRAQRTFIGTNGNPGNIIVVVSEGRYVDKVSEGLTYKECAEVLKHYGCSFGVPLDGGGSSTMVYRNQILNHLPKERELVDFVIFK